MCQQLIVLKTLRKRPNKSGLSEAQIQLAEAAGKDYDKMKNRVESIESKVNRLEKVVATKTDLKQLKSDLLPLRDKAARWDLILSMTKSWKFWAFIILCIACVALAGQRVIEILFSFPIRIAA